MKLKPSSLFAATLCAALLASAAPHAVADDGHGHDEAPSSAEASTLPRFDAVSEKFELVGILDGASLTLYLDHYADNRPVQDARIALLAGDAAVSAEAHGEGEFHAELPMIPLRGALPVVATVTVGEEMDLLAANLDIHAEDEEDETRAASPARARAFPIALAGIAIVALGFAGWRFSTRKRSAQ